MATVLLFWDTVIPIRHFRNEKRPEAKMRLANASGIVSVDVLVSYWPIELFLCACQQS